jgi:hypothetical protein
VAGGAGNRFVGADEAGDHLGRRGVGAVVVERRQRSKDDGRSELFFEALEHVVQGVEPRGVPTTHAPTARPRQSPAITRLAPFGGCAAD